MKGNEDRFRDFISFIELLNFFVFSYIVVAYYLSLKKSRKKKIYTNNKEKKRKII